VKHTKAKKPVKYTKAKKPAKYTKAKKPVKVSGREPGQPAIRTLSVVMAAKNEHAFVVQTVESIQATTPEDVLKEIIVVDDNSDYPMARDLQDHPDVRVIRFDTNQGLMRARATGANSATGDAIMFLDAHVKPQENWSQPLLRHLNENYKRVVVPTLLKLNVDTWDVDAADLLARGQKMMFDWTLACGWMDGVSSDTHEVPIMVGGIYAITRQWWHESGEYDYGMKGWGTEQVEQSVRIWLCGGEILYSDQSLIAHYFRPVRPYAMNATEADVNKLRTVEVWFDDYKANFYAQAPGLEDHAAERMGDISERLALKDALGCRPFQWYVDKFRPYFDHEHLLPSI